MYVYVAWCEGYMCSGWISFAGNNEEKMKEKIIKDFETSVDEIQIYDEQTMEIRGYIKVRYIGVPNNENNPTGFKFERTMYEPKIQENRK